MIEMDYINGGVCAAKGFSAAGIHCGIRKNKTKKDLALIVSDVAATAAAVYTTNLVKGAPLVVTKKNLSDGRAQAIICNSGIANTCSENGEQTAFGMCELVERHTGVKGGNVVVASTGVIGQPLNIEPIADGMERLVERLGDNSKDAAHAIMTTDTVLKEAAVSFDIGGKKCRMGGIAKGSGMINPNMATMLVFITSDVKISEQALRTALSADAADTFNMINIDGDTSTNDMVVILANGLSENDEIDGEGEDFDTFCSALNHLTSYLSRMIAKDGEGASKLLECIVQGAADIGTARKAAKSVVSSNLLKAAMFGADANWGRVLCAIGYGGANVDVEKVDISFKSVVGDILVCKNGKGVDFSEEHAKEILLRDEIQIIIDLKSGDFKATAWGCDLTYDYVKINGDYRT